MDNNTSLAIYVGLAILLIFYFVVSFFSGKTWKVTHVLLAICVFFASAVFFVMAVMTLKTHQEWREVYLTLKAEVTEQDFQNDLLENGVGRDPKGDLQELEESVRELREKVDQELYDRDRVWRNCQPDSPSSFDGNSIDLNVTQALVARILEPNDRDPIDGELTENEIPTNLRHVLRGADTDQNGKITKAELERVDKQDLCIQAKEIVYAFKETQTPEEWSVPAVYLGEFQVEGPPTATSVTLKPTLPLDELQIEQIRSGGTWVLYEHMPVDSYYAFAGLRDETAENPDVDFANKLRQLMPPTKLGVTGAAYDRLINEYVRDRKTANPASDPPERIWKRVVFKQSPQAIKVDSDDEQAQAAKRHYDATGRAVPAALRTGDVTEDAMADAARSEKGVIYGIKNLVSSGDIALEPGEIKFDIDDEALLDSKTADDLIGSGVAEEVEAVFVRELRDYAFEFHDLYMRRINLNDFASRLTYDTRLLVGAGDQANIRVTYRTGERDTIQADLERFQAEKDALAEYYAELEAQHRQLMTDLSMLYRTNNALAAELARHQYNLARSINAQTQTTEPTESAPRGATPPPSAP